MFVLTILSAWVLGSVVVAIISRRGARLSVGQWAITAFVIGILVAGFFTDVKYTAFFGAMQRNDGVFSYLALATLSIAAMMSFEPANMKQIRTGLLVIALVLTGYGFLQTYGRDPVKWVRLYGPVIGTLGNPDFLSGLLGVASVATLWVIFAKEKIWLRWTGVILLLLELFIIRRSASIQGFFAFGAGLILLTIVKLWHLNKRAGITSFFFAGIALILGLLGLLNKGPLAAVIYHRTIRNRIDYWHAAINMFKAHPFVGIGLDRFGENYGQYAPQIQVSQGTTTDNAHNVFLQLLATGGLVVIIPYLFLLGVILWTAMRGIKNSVGDAQIHIVALFAIWIALLLISCISIDNLGVAVWFWISGGALYGVAHKSLRKDEQKPIGKSKAVKSAKRTTQSSLSYIAPIASLIITIVVLIAMVPAWRGSSMLNELQRNKSRLTQPQFAAKLKEIANIQPNNVQTLLVLSNTALNTPWVDLALSYAKKANEKDLRSYFGNYLSAIAYEGTKKSDQAIPYRIRLTELDPWNTPNMLQLVKDYVQVKDLVKAQVIAARISQLQPNGGDAQAAAALIKG